MSVSPWLLNGKEFTVDDVEENIGFVYLITNTKSDKRYVGKKIFHFTNRVKKKGRKNRVIVKKKSDWENYWGSSEDLLADIAEHGKENFTREILHLCANKSQCSYYELKEQIERKVMEHDGYYNKYIMARIHKTKNLVIT